MGGRHRTVLDDEPQTVRFPRLDDETVRFARPDEDTEPFPSVSAQPESPRRKSAFLPGLHAFRALAAVLVIGQHTVVIPDWPTDSLVHRVVAGLVGNSSVLFVFLSGYLFVHLDGRYSYLGFLRRRFTTVVIPYLCVLTPAAVLAVMSPLVGGAFTDTAGQPALIRLGWFFLHGATMVNVALWFIPMIALFYLCSPVFSMFARWPQLYWVLLILVPFSMLAHRPALVPHADTLAFAAYFASAWVLGMLARQYSAKLRGMVRYWWVLVGCYVIALISELLFLPFFDSIEVKHLFSQEHGPIDWKFAQRVVLCFALLAVTERFAGRLSWLRYLGFASFSVYLLHCYLVSGARLAIAGFHIKAPPLLIFLGTLTVALTGSLLLVALTRMVLGRWSLYVIGSASERPG